MESSDDDPRHALRRRPLALALATSLHWPCVALLGALPLSSAFAQTCPISSNSITLFSGQCIVAPGTTLTQTGNYETLVAAFNSGTVIDLTPGATLIGNGFQNIAVQMIDGGVVRLGASTPITLTASNGNPAILIENTDAGTLGSNIPLSITNANSTAFGLQATLGSQVTLGLDLQAVDALTGVRADSGSSVTLVDASSINMGQSPSWFSGAALMATGTDSVIDARSNTQISMSGEGVVGAYMSDGGRVRVDASTGFSLSAPAGSYGSNGIVVDNTIAPTDTLGANLVLTLAGRTAPRWRRSTVARSRSMA